MGTQKKGTSIEVLSPVEVEATAQAVRWNAAAMGLSPWEQWKLEWAVKRQRADAVRRVAEVETATVVGEAIEHGRGRVRAAAERAELTVHAERMACINQAGRIHEEGLAVARGLSEDSRELIQGALDRVTVRYLQGAERRAAGGCFE